MRKIQLSDVKPLQDYELIREEWRKSVIEEKAKRRVLLGPIMSLVFENRLTVLGQIQEMCRAERIVRPEAVQHEIDTYNELLPDAGEVAATLLIEITEESQIQSQLDRLLGLTTGHHLFFELGERRIPARFLGGQSREDRIAAVQYLRFPLGDEEATRAVLVDRQVPAAIRAEHPNYGAFAPLSFATREELARDLAGA
jgi:hypothetical protein